MGTLFCAHTSVCNDPATTKARILAFALLLVQTNNQSINQSIDHQPLLVLFLQDETTSGLDYTLSSNSSEPGALQYRSQAQAVRTNKPSQITQPTSEKLLPLYFPSADRTNEPLTTLYSTGTYIPVHDNTARCSLKLKLTETTSGLYGRLYYFSKTILLPGYIIGPISAFLQDEASLLPGYIIWYCNMVLEVLFLQDETSLLPG
jgi:hypothetical protein